MKKFTDSERQLAIAVNGILAQSENIVSDLERGCTVSTETLIEIIEVQASVMSTLLSGFLEAK